MISKPTFDNCLAAAKTVRELIGLSLSIRRFSTTWWLRFRHLGIFV